MSCQQMIYKYDKNKLHDNQIIAKKNMLPLVLNWKILMDPFNCWNVKSVSNIDEHLTWKNQISFIRARISRNIGIISKLRNYLSIQHLKQIYYNLLITYPYISYGILAWGSTYKSNLISLHTKQNHIARLIFS